MTEYKIIEEVFCNSEKATKIVKEVQELIRDGWQPCGEVCLSNFSHSDGSGTTRIAQPILKKAGNITDYVLIRGYVGESMHTLIENHLLKGYELFGNLKSVGLGVYYQVVIKRMQLIPDLL
jgi:hypothetical protein